MPDPFLSSSSYFPAKPASRPPPQKTLQVQEFSGRAELNWRKVRGAVPSCVDDVALGSIRRVSSAALLVIFPSAGPCSNARRACASLRPRFQALDASDPRQRTRVQPKVRRPAGLRNSRFRVRVRPSRRRGQGRPGEVLGGGGQPPEMVPSLEQDGARGGSRFPKLVGLQGRDATGTRQQGSCVIRVDICVTSLWAAHPSLFVGGVALSQQPPQRACKAPKVSQMSKSGDIRTLMTWQLCEFRNNTFRTHSSKIFL